MKNHTLTLATLGGALLLAACGEQLTTPVPLSPSQPAEAHRGQGASHDIAFTSNRSGNLDIWVMDAGGTDGAGEVTARNLTADNAGADQSAAWSNDGRLAFASVRADHANSEIYVMDADGGNLARITNSTEANIQPAWSPNGKQMAFVRGAQGSRQIWVIDVREDEARRGSRHAKRSRRLSGNGERLLTHAGDNYHPAWSPNGKRIIFSSDRNGDFANASPVERGASFGLHDIYIMDASAGDAKLTRITDNPTSLDGEPSFSPNGKEIVFRTRRNTAVDPDGQTRHWCTIAVANVDGTQMRYLTPKPADVLSTGWCNAFPVWSRDGKQIYFHSIRTAVAPTADIYVIGADGTGTRRLTFDLGADTAPAVR